MFVIIINFKRSAGQITAVLCVDGRGRYLLIIAIGVLQSAPTTRRKKRAAGETRVQVRDRRRADERVSKTLPTTNAVLRRCRTIRGC